MASVFVDTSAFYALAAEQDRWHEAAQGIHERLKRAGARLATTNYVLLETISLVQRRHGVAQAERFGESAAERMDILWIDRAQHQAAWTTWKQQRRRGLSLVDCASFAVMRERGIQSAFAFDPQFDEAGFLVLTASSDRVGGRRAAYRVSGRHR